MTVRTTVHLVRHGEVYNPEGVLYGRLPGYHLSELGRTMAMRVGQSIADRDITHVFASPLERAQETAQPTADAHGLDIVTDARVIESANVFEGRRFSVGDGILKRPKMWQYLWNPFRPSWGEPYKAVVARMMAAVYDARDTARGHEAVIVSHQLPVWITRLHVEGRPFVHNPRNRQCTLCSLTSLTFEDETITTVRYSEPAADLIPVKDRKANFSSGGSPQQTPEQTPDQTPTDPSPPA